MGGCPANPHHMVCDSRWLEAPLAENPHSVMRGVSHPHLRVEEMVAQLKSLYRGHSDCILVDGSMCTLAASANVDDRILRVMLESVENIEFGVNDGLWCSLSTQGKVPNECKNE